MRLDKLVCDTLGVSRKDAKSLIKKGLVLQSGLVLKDPSQNVDEKIPLIIDGKETVYRKFIYLMMNKPPGYVSSTEDKKQKTVLCLLSENFSRYDLFPAGRLDIDTEGFLLLTNDGQTAHNLLSPSKKVPKEYFARLQKPLSDKDKQTIENGVDIGGYITKPSQITKKSENEVIIKISEGKFHQVKKMFESVENKVIYLKRISFASLPLDPSLAPGEYRFLTAEEVDIIGGEQ